MAKKQLKDRPSVMIDEPPPYGTLETWEQYLSDLKKLPADTLGKPQMIEAAEKSIAGMKQAKQA